MNVARRPRTTWPWLALLLLVCVAPAQAALQLQPFDQSLSPAEAAATRQILADVTPRLPVALTDALDQRIEVEWRDDLPVQVHGHAGAHRMLLNRTLLIDWMARPRDAGVEDPATHAALAAVIHELAHFYDRTPQGGLSRDPRLLDLAGWQVSPMRLGLRSSTNAFSDRSPDRYELTSPAEFFAVNLEYFFLDPSYACRRPALYRYFAAHFGNVSTEASCAPNFVALQVGTADESVPPVLQIDPSRVYAVEYLLAEANERPLSRWGHSMLRLVICAPGRALGPDCRFDLQYHQVLSFRAFVGDVQISSWRGLTGSYPSRLYVLPLEQVIDEYTKVELRGLQSIPLQLDRAEIADLVERAMRLHWSYDGRYYFLSNNCAVETFKLLHDGVPRLAGAHLASITPTALLRRLERAGIADPSVLADREEALRLGYRFDALSDRYQAMFDIARDALRLPQTHVQDWLDMDPHERKPWLERADLRTGAALLLLEEAALRRQELLARNELKRRFFQHVPDPQLNGVDPLVAVQEAFRIEGFLSRPAMLLPGTGYGLPQYQERALLTQESDQLRQQWTQQSAWLRDAARQWLPPQQLSALDATAANVDELGNRLRQLNKEQGGLQLPDVSAGTN